MILMCCLIFILLKIKYKFYLRSSIIISILFYSIVNSIYILIGVDEYFILTIYSGIVYELFVISIYSFFCLLWGVYLSRFVKSSGWH